MTERQPTYGDQLQPQPLSEHELAQLEASASVTGLSSVDARRLIAEIRRLRVLVGQACLAVDEKDPDFLREVWARLKAEVERG